MHSNEVEIKFRIEDLRLLGRALRQAGFHLKTRRTREINTLYDFPGELLQDREALLRLRKYGSEWILTYKAKGKPGRHKSRPEMEVRVDDGIQMDAILRLLGLHPSFRYEKFRAEWSDGTGHVAVDETPIGDLGEIEGPSRWIDRTARALGLNSRDYITSTYAELFFQWKQATRSRATEMTFAQTRRSRRRHSLLSQRFPGTPGFTTSYS